MGIPKSRLRNTLKKLRRIPLDRSDPTNVAMAPQEMLDFLAMLAGLKAVCLLGRGFDDATWVASVEALAHDMRLHAIRGPEWYAEPKHIGLPAWYSEVNTSVRSGEPALYVCRSRAVADELRQVCAAGSITMEQEAMLLGYPLCCVKDRYRRTRLMNEAFSLMLHRTAEGNETKMKHIVRESTGMSAETEQERRLIEEVRPFAPASFTSINMCPSCANKPDSPAVKVSRAYEHLARSISPDLANEIKGWTDMLRTGL